VVSAQQELEWEAVTVLRECPSIGSRGALLFSGGKDSIAVAMLARMAFSPGRCPWPLLHIDTGHNFPETIAFRDQFALEMGFDLVVRQVQDTIDEGRAVEEAGPQPSRNAIQSVTLRDALEELRLDFVLGGARRDEEKARAKERFFSHRDSYGAWQPKKQRPEPWDLYNLRKKHGEHFRVFPISNWTEEDVYCFALRRRIALPSLYFSHERDLVNRGGVLMAKTPWLSDLQGDKPLRDRVRFRTVGDATCTGAIRSEAGTLEEVLAEVRSSRLSERSTRADDQRSESAMEERKKEGYF
jgi:sulfate adenylyltransferase subunit 2